LNALNLAVIPGDGIGPEVTSVALSALEKALDSANLKTTTYELGAGRFLAGGEVLTDEDLAKLRQHDAICLVQSGTHGFPQVCSSAACS
jgi:3-isopropylmalate dehydrogenase